MESSVLVFEREEYNHRMEKLREAVSNIDFSVIFNRADLYYYSNTGFDGLITIGEEPIRYTKRNLQLAEDESTLETKFMSSFRLFKDLGKSTRIKTLGLELDLLPYRTVEYISDAFDNPELIDISHQLRLIRSIKSPAEVNVMKKATRQTDRSFEYIQDKITPGMTELELSAMVERFLRREGHPGWVQVRSFQHNLTTTSYVMAGESTATLNSKFGPVSGQGLCKMHKNGPSKRKIRSGDAVLIDTTGVVDGYIADETRTYFVDKVPRKLIEAHEFAKSIQSKTREILRDGTHVSQVYEELNQLAKEAGLWSNFMGIAEDKVPFIGHGVGLELDEYPIITDRFDYTLEEGNIVAIEPKLIFNEPKTGVGIEDTWLVKKGFAEKLTKTPW